MPSLAFSIFDHAGDIGVDIRAPSLNLLFAGAAAAFTQAIVERGTVREIGRSAVSLEHDELDLRLVEWLGEPALPLRGERVFP